MNITRRHFGALLAGTALVPLLPIAPIASASQHSEFQRTNLLSRSETVDGWKLQAEDNGDGFYTISGYFRANGGEWKRYSKTVSKNHRSVSFDLTPENVMRELTA